MSGKHAWVKREPLCSSVPLESRPTLGWSIPQTTRAYAEAICAKRTISSGSTSGLAPMSANTVLPPLALGKAVVMQGRMGRRSPPSS